MIIVVKFLLAVLSVVVLEEISKRINPVLGGLLSGLLLGTGLSVYFITYQRGVIVGVIILFITTIGSIAGSRWAGILSSFPSTLFALIVVLNFEDGKTIYPSVIRGFSYGISTLLIFHISCNFILPLFGLNIGFILTLIISLIHLIVIKEIKSNLSLIKYKRL